MAAKKGFFSRFRLVYRRSSPLLKWVVLVTILLCTVTLVLLGVLNAKEKEEQAALNKQIATAEQENRKWKDCIAQLGTVQSVVRIAMEELDMMYPDAVVYETVPATDPE